MTLSLDDVSLIGSGLSRPECVLATAKGDLYTADWRGGVAHLRPDGTQTLYTGQTADLPEGLRPNGIALEPDGSFLLANLGSEAGGVWRVTRDGQVAPYWTQIDGAPIAPSNYLVRDHVGRLWLTVSTTMVPRSLDYRSDSKSGFIAVMDEKGARIVADGLGFTNECQISQDRRWLYVNETYGRRLSRFALRDDASLGPKEVIHEFGEGQFPDGLAFDIEGKIWIAGVISNQLMRIDPESGHCEIMLSETDPAHVAWVEQAYQANALGRPHMDTNPSTKLRNLSSIAFGGPDLRTGYLGCLLGDAIAVTRLDVAGVPPVHWLY
ncbi:MAG TPA: SMP-30/gluconolactonase/LRE family protein [Bosea sp. (in: a-proteobacteria)]|jgi:sugar lactone lactonase YvrE|uniref:SMP-30/gluconolactonase/LRE family protein n=1 Tax=Bosea sp. (in: a-proteobacteria) TaxID=1871050 RepID=UPI002E13C464|nr:SMP-30/gluconolactonase/LRE family protein [Bosea sp. (in: a-proteobacteria)]